MSSDDKTATQLTTMDYEELTFEKRVREQKERLGEEASEFVVCPYDTATPETNTRALPKQSINNPWNPPLTC